MLMRHLNNATDAWDRTYVEYLRARDAYMDAPPSHDVVLRARADELHNWAYSCQRAWRVAQAYFILDRIPR